MTLSEKSTKTTITLTVPANGALFALAARATSAVVPSGNIVPGYINPSLNPTGGSIFKPTRSLNIPFVDFIFFNSVSIFFLRLG